MKTSAIAFFLLSATYVSAQPISDLVVYTTEPDPFYLILNGIKQNDEPMTNVRVTDLTLPAYDARVIFESDKVQIDKKIFFAEPGLEHVYKIVEKKNGELTLRVQSITALNLAPPPPANQQRIVYHSVPSAQPVQQTVTTTSTVTQTTGINTSGVNMAVGMPGFNMNVNINDPTLNMNQGSMVVRETVTTSTTGAPLPDHTVAMGHYVMPGYSGPIGCPWPMDEGQFTNAQRSVTSRDFEESKMTVAKQITGANCLTADQVRRMMGAFDFEETKLEYAKFAYNKTHDIGNYYMLNDAFDFESSIDELNAFINGW